MATIAELRAAYPDFLKDKLDTDIVRMLAEKDGLSLPYVAYELGLDPAEWQQNEGTMDDLGTSLELGYEQTKRGIANLPNVVSGLVTGENLYETPGMDNTIQRIQSTFSPGYYETQQAQDSAWDEGRYLDYAAGLVTTPYLANQMAQSVPSLVGGGIVGAGLRGVAALGALGRGVVARGVGTAAPFIGEGSVSTGVGYKNLLDQGVDPQTAALAGIAQGVGAGAAAGLGGYLAGKAGYVDPERFFAGMTRRVGDETVPLSYKGQIGYGMLAEGAEEAVQSPWEEAVSNVAQDKPWDEGLGRAALEGALAGGIIGGGINALTPPLRRKIDSNTQTDLLQDQPDPTKGLDTTRFNLPSDVPSIRNQVGLNTAEGLSNWAGVQGPSDTAGYTSDLTASYNEPSGHRVADKVTGVERELSMGDWLYYQATGQLPPTADPVKVEGKPKPVEGVTPEMQRLLDVARSLPMAADPKNPKQGEYSANGHNAKGRPTKDAIKWATTLSGLKTVDEVNKETEKGKTGKAGYWQWVLPMALARIQEINAEQAQTLAQQAKQNDTVDGPGVPVTPTIAQNAQPTEGVVTPTPTTSSVVQPDGVKAVPEGGTPPVVPVPPPSPTTPETPTNALSGQTTPQAGQTPGITPPAPPVPGVTNDLVGKRVTYKRSSFGIDQEYEGIVDSIDDNGNAVLRPVGKDGNPLSLPPFYARASDLVVLDQPGESNALPGQTTPQTSQETGTTAPIPPAPGVAEAPRAAQRVTRLPQEALDSQRKMYFVAPGKLSKMWALYQYDPAAPVGSRRSHVVNLATNRDEAEAKALARVGAEEALYSFDRETTPILRGAYPKENIEVEGLEDTNLWRTGMMLGAGSAPTQGKVVVDRKGPIPEQRAAVLEAVRDGRVSLSSPGGYLGFVKRGRSTVLQLADTKGKHVSKLLDAAGVDYKNAKGLLEVGPQDHATAYRLGVEYWTNTPWEQIVGTNQTGETSANPSPIQSDQETVPVPGAAAPSLQGQGSGNRELAAKQGGQTADADQTQTKPTLNFSRSGQGQPAPGFFSQLKRVVERAKQTTMPGGQWKAWLKANQAQLGVKQEEIEATGIDEYLDARGKDKVTREEIAAFVENNGVRVEEVTKESDTAEFDKWQLPGGTNYKELLLTLPAKPTAQQAELETKRAALHEELRTAPVARQQEILAELDTLLPAMDRADQTASAGQYQSGHYSEPNILAHVRINERTDTEGKRVLFVEEIQSDWGQEGKKKGFVSGDWEAPYREWERGLRERAKSFYLDAAETEEERAAAIRMGEKLAAREDLDSIATVMGERPQMAEAWAKAIALRYRVPAAPFVTNTKSWTALALKRLMTYAVENGFDRVAWTTGEQQAERYDLSKQVKRVVWNESAGILAAERADSQGARDDRPAIRYENVTRDKLADYIGKEAAERIQAEPQVGAWRALEGDNLRLGGQGMKAFYDGIVPQVANDLLKKLGGGRVGSVAVNISEGKKTTASQQFGFDITPTMRAKVQGGLPLFARKPNKAKQTSGNTVADVERWIAGPKAKLAQWVTNGLNVVQSVDELRARYPGMDIPDDVVGMHEGGYVFLVADNITSANQARKALAHEVVGHLGLERMLGKKGFERIVRQIDSYIRTQNPAVLQALERVKAKYTDDKGKYNLNKVQEASEILAHLAERNPNFGLVREILARIRMWFAKHGLGNYAAAELNQLLVEAARFTETGFTSFAEGNFRVAPAFMVAENAPTPANARTNATQPLPETITIDGSNPNINFMRGPTKQDASNLWDWIKTETEAGVEAFSRKVGLGAMTNEQMADRWGKEFAPLKTIANVLDATEAKAAQWEKKAEDADRDWAALTAEQDQLMSEIMGDASLHGYDPDTGQLPVGHISKEQRARVMAAKVTLDARWQRLKTLDANGKHKAVAVYRQVRDYHQQRLQEAINYVRAQLQQKGTVRPDDPLLKSLEALEAMGKRPYFPLMRLGDYYVVGMSPQMADLEKRFRAKQLQPDEDALREKLRRDPKHYWVEGTSRLATAKRLAEKLRKEMGFAQYNAERYKLANARSHVGQDVGKFEQALEGMALDTKTHDALVEMYEQLLISALPEHHSLKRTLHREGIYGWDKNMRAVFAKTAQTGAWALSRMMHVSDLQQAMSELDEMSKTGEPNAQDARALHNELLARQDLTFTRYEDPLLVQGAMKFSYLSMLGFSPAFWMINLTQPWMVTLPYLTARNGNEFKATSSALWRGVREAFSMIESSFEGKELRTQFNPDKVNPQGQKVRLTADERRMLDTFGADGTLDFTIGYDLGAIAKGGSGKWQKVMRTINAPTHATELANRVGTALAAYRISIKNNHSHEQALAFAKEAVNTTQVNYNPANKARYMQAWAGNRWLPKLAFQFYTYQQAMAYLALSTLRDAIKGDKVAQSTMAWMTGMLGATGGIFALPFAQMTLGAASLIFSALGGGDDEEDVDFQRDLRNLFSDHLPEPVARLLNKGLGSMLLQTDLGARIGMGNLMNPLAFARFEAADKGADTVQEVLFRAGGAPVANVANAVDGLYAMRDVMGALVTGDAPKGSDVTDALSKLFPLKGVRDIFRGIELSAEGVTTGEGEPRLTDFSYLEVALQSAGITPLRKTMYYDRNAAIQGAKEAMKIARGDLIREYAQARLAGKPIGPILAKIGAFNQRNPQNRIDQDTLKRSTTQRQKDRQSLDNGILANKENRPYLAAGRWAE